MIRTRRDAFVYLILNNFLFAVLPNEPVEEEVEARDRGIFMRNNLMCHLSISRVSSEAFGHLFNLLFRVSISPTLVPIVLSFARHCSMFFQLKSNWNQLTKKSGARLSTSNTFKIINNDMFPDQLFQVRIILPNYQTSNIYACYLIFSRALKHDNRDAHRQVQWTN